MRYLTSLTQIPQGQNKQGEVYWTQFCVNGKVVVKGASRTIKQLRWLVKFCHKIANQHAEFEPNTSFVSGFVNGVKII